MDIKRKLATIRTIKSVEPIENADSIVKLTFESMGWVCVTNKDTNPQPGEKRVYFEVDSVLPADNPAFAFMDPYHYRVKTIRLRGQVSQGLSIPLDEIFRIPEIAKSFSDAAFRGEFGDARELATIPVVVGGMFPPTHWYPDPKNLQDGTDLTDILGVIKYEGPVDVQISGDTKGPFPGFIEKTDEERAQNFGQDIIEKMLTDHEFDVTIKCDGSSGTFYLFNVTDDPKSGEFGVCSRNQELKDTEGNIFWKMARKYNLEERLRGTGRNLAIQGEVVGPGIQSNRLGLTENKLLVFTIQDLSQAKRLSNEQIANVLDRMNEFAEGANLEMVPRILSVPPLKTLADIAALAEGTNLINDKPREGIVLRAKDDPNISCKFINPKYLIKYDL